MTDILERAKAQLAEGYTAINESVVRELIAEVEAKNDEIERLLSELVIAQFENPKTITIASYKLAAEQLERESCGWQNLREQISAKDARIAELEADRIAYRNLGSKIEELETHIERLEAAFLDRLAARLYYERYRLNRSLWADYPEEPCQMRPKEDFRQDAREALEQIKAETGSGGHKSEQREALELDELIAEVERLRSANLHLHEICQAQHDKIAAKDARIKELEAYIERLEAAFLASEIKRLDTPDQNHTWYPGDESYVDFVKRVKREAEHKAREALERIRNGP